MVEIAPFESDKLSTFRTSHRFLNYGTFDSADSFAAYRAEAKKRGLRLFILGNGSNTLFTRPRIRTLILRNKIPETITPLGGDHFEISASTQVMRVLKHCEKAGRDSFYFLASVPATVGGALAMNAGAGAGPTIFDFVETLTYLDEGGEVTVTRDEIARSHRQTMFTGVQDKLILKAVFVFPETTFEESPIRTRAHWARDNQDLASPNCGSVFREYHGPILRRMRALPPWGISWPILKSQYSRRVNNWIITKSSDPRPVVFLIRAVQAVHRLFGKRAVPEIIEVD